MHIQNLEGREGVGRRITSLVGRRWGPSDPRRNGVAGVRDLHRQITKICGCVGIPGKKFGWVGGRVRVRSVGG